MHPSCYGRYEDPNPSGVNRERQACLIFIPLLALFFLVMTVFFPNSPKPAVLTETYETEGLHCLVLVVESEDDGLVQKRAKELAKDGWDVKPGRTNSYQYKPGKTYCEARTYFSY
jgi:hypothetical protein